MRPLLLAVLLALPASPVAAQWTTFTTDGGMTFAGIAGTGGDLVVSVSCGGNGQVVMVSTMDRELESGAVDVVLGWDGPSRVRFLGPSSSKMASTDPDPASDFRTSYSPAAAELIANLRARSRVTIAVPAQDGGIVIDSFSLAGSSRAIGSLPCASSQVQGTTTPQRRTAASMKRPGMSLARSVASAIQGELDTPMDRVLPQMPADVSPERSRSGADRTFTYAFRDGSRLILAARPSGDGRGLALYFVDIQE